MDEVAEKLATIELESNPKEIWEQVTREIQRMPNHEIPLLWAALLRRLAVDPPRMPDGSITKAEWTQMCMAQYHELYRCALRDAGLNEAVNCSGGGQSRRVGGREANEEARHAGLQHLLREAEEIRKGAIEKIQQEVEGALQNVAAGARDAVLRIVEEQTHGLFSESLQRFQQECERLRGEGPERFQTTLDAAMQGFRTDILEEWNKSMQIIDAELQDLKTTSENIHEGIFDQIGEIKGISDMVTGLTPLLGSKFDHMESTLSRIENDVIDVNNVSVVTHDRVAVILDALEEVMKDLGATETQVKELLQAFHELLPVLEGLSQTPEINLGQSESSETRRMISELAQSLETQHELLKKIEEVESKHEAVIDDFKRLADILNRNTTASSIAQNMYSQRLREQNELIDRQFAYVMDISGPSAITLLDLSVRQSQQLSALQRDAFQSRVLDHRIMSKLDRIDAYLKEEEAHRDSVGKTNVMEAIEESKKRLMAFIDAVELRMKTAAEAANAAQAESMKQPIESLQASVQALERQLGKMPPASQTEELTTEIKEFQRQMSAFASLSVFRETHDNSEKSFTDLKEMKNDGVKVQYQQQIAIANMIKSQLQLFFESGEFANVLQAALGAVKAPEATPPRQPTPPRDPTPPPEPVPPPIASVFDADKENDAIRRLTDMRKKWSKETNSTESDWIAILAVYDGHDSNSIRQMLGVLAPTLRIVEPYMQFYDTENAKLTANKKGKDPDINAGKTWLWVERSGTIFINKEILQNILRPPYIAPEAFQSDESATLPKDIIRATLATIGNNALTTLKFIPASLLCILITRYCQVINSVKNPTAQREMATFRMYYEAVTDQKGREYYKFSASIKQFVFESSLAYYFFKTVVAFPTANDTPKTLNIAAAYNPDEWFEKELTPADSWFASIASTLSASARGAPASP